MKKIYFVLFAAFITGCNTKYDNRSETATAVAKQTNITKNTSQTNVYGDGTYCASLEFYDSTTENNYNCTLLVDIKNNNPIHISKTNCQTFDGSYVTFKPTSQQGTFSVESDKGSRYTLTINEKTALGSKRFQCDVCGKEIQ